MALSLLAIYLLFRFTSSHRLVYIAGSGLALGLVFLTKAEIFLAVLIGSLAGIIAMPWMRRQKWKFTIQTILIWAGSSILPAVISYLLLLQAMPSKDALNATMGTWSYILNAEHRGLLFFQKGMGTLDLPESVVRILKWIGGYIIVLLPAGGLALAYRRKSNIACAITAAVLFVLTGGVLVLFWLKWKMVEWSNIAQPLPLRPGFQTTGNHRIHLIKNSIVNNQ